MSHELALSSAARVPLLEKFVYKDPNMSPNAVSEHTSDIFSNYFGGKEPLSDPEKDYLSEKTMPFIDSVRVGLANYPEKIDRLGISSFEDYLRVISTDRKTVLPPGETLEAFDVSLITMGLMPRVAVKKEVDLEGNVQEIRFSRRGMLRPPVTLEETRQRIHELWVETLKIGNGNTPRRFNFLKYPETTRATLFFDVCKSIKLRTEEMQKDVEIRLAS